MGVRGKDPVEREKGAFVSRKNFSHVLLACGIVCALVFGEAEILWHDVMLPAFQRSLQVLLPPNLSPEPALYVDSGEIYDKNTMRAKPVIYLYPEQKTDVRVRLDYRGVWGAYVPRVCRRLECDGYPDGKLVNHADGGEYPYLFWEGRDRVEYDFSRGFVVRGEDTARFLRAKLEYMGLTPAEYNEFIVYWYPRMRDNPII